MSGNGGRRHALAAQLGVCGGVLGILAGVIQATAGTRVPEWTGAKADPVPLGLLTVLVSLLAVFAARRQARATSTVGSRVALALGLIGPGLLCFTTVGRLWYLPGALMLAAGALTIDSWRDTVAVITKNWLRELLSLLGAAELIMAAGAAVTPMAVGAVGGFALIVAAWLPVATPRTARIGLITLGTVPFAAVAWTAVVPVVVLVAAAAIAIPLVKRTPGRHPAGALGPSQ